MNAKMPELKRAFESAGFTNVVTVLASGNVVFDARAAAEETLARRAEHAMEATLGRRFATIVRPVERLKALLEADPLSAYELPRGAKRVVTFLARPPAKKPKLPIQVDGTRILAMDGNEVLTAYVPGPVGGAFMGVIEGVFGKDVTTRTWETVKKVAAKQGRPGASP